MLNQKPNIQAVRLVRWGSRIVLLISFFPASIIPVSVASQARSLSRVVAHEISFEELFAVLRKIAGWRRSSLGLLYYPNYIHNGIAIRGSSAMAVYPASHACIRIPMFASKELSELTPAGTEVIVYDD